MMMMRKVLKKKKKTSLVLICIILLFFLRCFSFTPVLLLPLLFVFDSRGSPKENISHKVLFY